MRGYIIGTESLKTIGFQFMPKVKHTRNLNAPNIPVVGTNNSILHATGGSSEYTLEAGFYVRTNRGEDVIAALRDLESLVYSEGNGNTLESVQLVIGKLFKDRLFFITNLDFDLDLLNPRSGYPQAAKVVIKLKEVYQNRNRNHVQWQQ